MALLKRTYVHDGHMKVRPTIVSLDNVCDVWSDK